MKNSENKIFLDANVIIAAVLSPTGGSFRLITESPQRGFSLFTSRYGLEETLENIKEKYPQSLASLKNLLLASKIKILSDASAKETLLAAKWIDPKDTPILAAALKHKMDFLITLDKEHFLTTQLNKAQLPLKISTPGTFIQKYFS